MKKKQPIWTNIFDGAEKVQKTIKHARKLPLTSTGKDGYHPRRKTKKKKVLPPTTYRRDTIRSIFGF